MTLSVGGLWLLYGTGLFGAMHYPVVHAIVHAHVTTAGYLFTYPSSASIRSPTAGRTSTARWSWSQRSPLMTFSPSTSTFIRQWG